MVLYIFMMFSKQVFNNFLCLRLLSINISLFFIFYLSGCNKKPTADENIYESKEYKSITKKDLLLEKLFGQHHVSGVIVTALMAQSLRR